VRSLPSPRTQPGVGHLGRWAIDPLALLEEGAELGSVFSLRLWRRTIVGFSPAWNRLVLGDIATFRSRGSLSRLSPYLAGGVVQTDAPEHGPRRRQLNPSFHRRALTDLTPRIAAITRTHLPVGDFEATGWASALIQELLCAVFFDGAIATPALTDFLRPLDSALPGPLLPRPRRFARMNRTLSVAIDQARAPTLGSVFTHLDNGVEEARVALSAGYDTTAHTLAWILWHLAENNAWAHPDTLPWLVEEALRLYPAGWVGSRVCAVPVTFQGVTIPVGTLVLYSPYLTHHDPTLWPEAWRFRPERFAEPLPAWGFIPFAAGQRTCLGMHLARLILRTVVAEFAGSILTRTGGDAAPLARITLAPRGQLQMNRAEGPTATVTTHARERATPWAT